MTNPASHDWSAYTRNAAIAAALAGAGCASMRAQAAPEPVATAAPSPAQAPRHPGIAWDPAARMLACAPSGMTVRVPESWTGSTDHLAAGTADFVTGLPPGAAVRVQAYGHAISLDDVFDQWAALHRAVASDATGDVTLADFRIDDGLATAEYATAPVAPGQTPPRFRLAIRVVSAPRGGCVISGVERLDRSTDDPSAVAVVRAARLPALAAATSAAAEHAWSGPARDDGCAGSGSPPRELWSQVPVHGGELWGRFLCNLSLFLR